ncbi:MAG: roadblock/LC7 domain-containing protein, partial [Candidatus Helarchaeota archaeon]
KMQALHYKLNAYKSIKGTLLFKDNGLHVSSNIQNPESRRLAALYAGIFRTINRIERVHEAQIRLKNGLSLYMKKIPSKKVVLTALSDEADSKSVKTLMKLYARMFRNAF